MVPMKVKNGIARSSSLFKIENNEIGKLPMKAAGNQPIWIAYKPLAKPKAAREKATGNPISMMTISPANMTGAKLTISIF
jgi:hypothetical protein